MKVGRVAIPIVAALGAIPGAVTGLILGLTRTKRQLIYEGN